MESPVRVTIVGDTRVDDCEAGCATDWADEESLRLAGERIRDRFGELIELRYIDLATSADREFLKWGEEIGSGKLTPPLLLFNGQLRIAGGFDIRQLLDVIEVETELEV